jgi:glycosyltransferase involved in cell wall biosynthesis
VAPDHPVGKQRRDRKDAMKRLTFILTQSLECPSGLGRYWPLAQGLVERGYRVTVLALHPDFANAPERRFSRDGVDIRYVGQMHVRKSASDKQYFGSLALLWISSLATLKLMWAALTTPSEIYHIGKPHPMNGMAAILLLALGRSVFLDCDDIEATSNRFGGRWQRSIVAWFEDYLPRWVHGVTVNTTFLRARVRPLVPEDRPVVLVPNAVDSLRCQPPDPAAVADIRRKHQLAGHRVVAYVGSMSLTNHAVDLLLEGFASIVAGHVPDALLLLVGGGEDLPTLKQLAVDLDIDSRVRFIGRVPPDEVMAYYAGADVAADPVHDDEVAQARSPLKLYESLAAGIPIVTGDIGDRRDALDGNSLMLVPAGDARALGKAIVRLLEDPDARERIRRWAESHHEQFFWENRIDEFALVYETI